MNLNRIDLNLLVVFDAIARTGSVKDAAPQLSLSQPAVSHALNRLRDLIGDPLFVRSHTRLVPTERARSMMEPVKAILSAVRSVIDVNKFSPASTKRNFRIAISDFTALTIVPWLVRTLRQRAPSLELDLVSVNEQTLAQLETGELDCTFWGLNPPPSPYLSQLLFHDHFVAFCCASHPLVRDLQRRVTLDEYLSYPHAIASFRAANASPVDVVLAGQGQARNITLRSPSFMSNITAISGTDLITTLPSRLAPLALSQGLSNFTLPMAVPDFPYSLVWHRRTDPDPACAWFRQLLTQPFSSDETEPAQPVAMPL